MLEDDDHDKGLDFSPTAIAARGDTGAILHFGRLRGHRGLKLSFPECLPSRTTGLFAGFATMSKASLRASPHWNIQP